MSCDWPIDLTCLPALPAEADAAYPAALAAQEGGVAIAVSVLWALSGRRFGVCPTTVRPCPDAGSRSAGNIPSTVLIRDGGHWRSDPCGCAGSCRLSGPRRVHLPGPVQTVTGVKIAGEPLAEGTDYVLEGDLLYRIGDNWPGQDLGRPNGEPGTWSVSYERGEPVPPGVDRLTGLLALEFINSCSGSGKCRLPRNVTSVTRQGVSYQVYDPQTIYASGKTGLAEIDTWLAAVNPHAIMQAAVVV